MKTRFSFLLLGLLLSSNLLHVGCAKNHSNLGTDENVQVDESISTQEIVNGTAVSGFDVMSLSTVAFYIEHPRIPGSNSLLDYCTGTLISKDVVLTAAHCFADFAAAIDTTVEDIVKHSRVGFGVATAKSLQDRRVQFRKIKSVRLHQQYVVDSVNTATTTPMFDIALVKIDGVAPAGFKSAKLATQSSVIRKGLPVTLVGFGLTDGLRGTDAVQMMKVTVEVDNPRLSATQFSYKVINGKSACSGDSGGPAYVKLPGNDIAVVGVTSWGDRFCRQMGAYTSVPAMSNWILSNLSKLN